MANICELLINALTSTRAKGTDRPWPKWQAVGCSFVLWEHADKSTAGGEAEPNPLVSSDRGNVETPYAP
jgi:hypothetical protein